MPTCRLGGRRGCDSAYMIKFKKIYLDPLAYAILTIIILRYDVCH